MKRNIINMLAVFVLLLACTVGFAGCGKKADTPVELKPEDFVGTWYVESVVDVQDGVTAPAQTYARLMELHNKADKTSAEIEEYDDLRIDCIYMFDVQSNGNLRHKDYFAEEEDYSESSGTWGIEDNKLTATITMFPANSKVSVDYKDGKITIVCSWTMSPHSYVRTIVLAKLAA